MKILMFTNHYLPHISGVATSIKRTMKGLENLGNTVHLIAPRYPHFFETDSRISRIPSLPLPIIPLPFPLRRLIARISEKFSPEIIHTHHPFLLGKIAMKISKAKKIPLVFTYHAMYEHYIHYIPLVPVSFLKSAVIKKVMNFANNASAVVAPSLSVAEVLRKRGIKTLVRIIPTGIELDKFKITATARQKTRETWNARDGSTVIVTFARLAPEKNFEFVLKAFARLINDYAMDDLMLVVGGDGPSKNSLENLAETLGIKKNTLFPGAIKHENIPDFLAGADIFAFASLSETQGLVTLEALAAGLPAVVVDAPGSRDVVENGKSGLIAKPEIADFTGILHKVITDFNLRKRLSEGARERAKEFSEDKIAQRLNELYKELL